MSSMLILMPNDGSMEQGETCSMFQILRMYCLIHNTCDCWSIVSFVFSNIH